MEDQYFSTRWGELHATVGGHGMPTILIHGRNPAFNSWRTWIKNVEPLSTVVLVYALDMLGYGESAKPEPPLSAAQHVETVADLLDEAHAQAANVIGLSWGGGIALMLALAHPSRVAKLVLADASLAEAQVNELAQLEAPVLITWDETDIVIPVARAWVLQHAIPGSRLVTWGDRQRDEDANPQNRHWSQMTHSREWNHIVSEFLSQDR